MSYYTYQDIPINFLKGLNSRTKKYIDDKCYKIANTIANTLIKYNSDLKFEIGIDYFHIIIKNTTLYVHIKNIHLLKDNLKSLIKLIDIISKSNIGISEIMFFKNRTVIFHNFTDIKFDSFNIENVISYIMTEKI